MRIIFGRGCEGDWIVGWVVSLLAWIDGWMAGWLAGWDIPRCWMD